MERAGGIEGAGARLEGTCLVSVSSVSPRYQAILLKSTLLLIPVIFITTVEATVL